MSSIKCSRVRDTNSRDDRRLARRARHLVDVGTDRLAGAGVAAGAHAREHALEDDVGELVARREVSVRAQLDFLAAVDGASARTPHRHAAPAERHFAALVPVPNRVAIAIVAALRAHDLVDLGLHQLVQHSESDANAQRQQPFLRRAGELAERLAARAPAAPRRAASPAATDTVGTVLMRLVLLSSRTWLAPVTVPAGPDEAGGPPPSSSTSYGTTSSRARPGGSWEPHPPAHAAHGQQCILERDDASGKPCCPAARRSDATAPAPRKAPIHGCERCRDAQCRVSLRRRGLVARRNRAVGRPSLWPSRKRRTGREVDAVLCESAKGHRSVPTFGGCATSLWPCGSQVPGRGVGVRRSARR